MSDSIHADVSPMLCRNWRTRKGRMTVASGSKAKVVDSPTDNITCPHGDLLPESAGTRARRISLPRDLWGFVRGSWQAAELKRAQEAAEAATEAATAAETAAVARQADLLEGAPADRSNGWVWPSEMHLACRDPGAVRTAVIACGPHVLGPCCCQGCTAHVELLVDLGVHLAYAFLIPKN